MNKLEKVFSSCRGIVLYHYDFTNKEGIRVNTTKALFNVFNCPIYINSPLLNGKKIGSEFSCSLYYDGKEFKLDAQEVKD